MNDLMPDTAEVSAWTERKRKRWQDGHVTMVALVLKLGDVSVSVERQNTKNPSEDAERVYAILCAVELAKERKPFAHRVVVTLDRPETWDSQATDARKYRHVAEKMASGANMIIEVRGRGNET